MKAFDSKGNEIIRFIIEDKESLDIFDSQLQYFPSKDSGKEEMCTNFERFKYVGLLQKFHDEIWLNADGSIGCKIMMITDGGTYIKYLGAEMFSELITLLKIYIPSEFIPDFLWQDKHFESKYLN